MATPKKRKPAPKKRTPKKPLLGPVKPPPGQSLRSVTHELNVDYSIGEWSNFWEKFEKGRNYELIVVLELEPGEYSPSIPRGWKPAEVWKFAKRRIKEPAAFMRRLGYSNAEVDRVRLLCTGQRPPTPTSIRTYIDFREQLSQHLRGEYMLEANQRATVIRYDESWPDHYGEDRCDGASVVPNTKRNLDGLGTERDNPVAGDTFAVKPGKGADTGGDGYDGEDPDPDVVVDIRVTVVKGPLRLHGAPSRTGPGHRTETPKQAKMRLLAEEGERLRNEYLDFQQRYKEERDAE
jgi:hypothetical protein